MTDVLDELREALVLAVVSSKQRPTSKRIDAILDAFERDHPGLNDCTIECWWCGRKGAYWESAGATFDRGGDGVAVEEYDESGGLEEFEFICPTCAAEATSPVLARRRG